jgi:Domain of unknown function (DUF1707)
MMPGDPRLRASDSDRERTATLLSEHHAAGRLTAEEFQERLDKAYEAKTLGELDALLADLPAIDLYRLPAAGIRPESPDAKRRVHRRGGGPLTSGGTGGWVAWSTISALLIVAWFSTAVLDGGTAWLPWFLLAAVPWLIFFIRRRHY